VLEVLVVEILLALMTTLALISTYLAIVQKDLVKAVVYSAVESASFSIFFFLLMAPDLALCYIPIGVGIYPAIVLMLIKKTERFENEG